MKIYLLQPIHPYLFAIILFFSFGKFHLLAQPSGGPYGTIDQTYEIPESAIHVYYVSTDGNAENTGKNISEPTTLEKAVKIAKTGDAVILRGGVYRTGNLVFNQGIIIQPYKDEKPVLNGSYPANDWTSPKDGLWVTNWKYLFPGVPENWWNRKHEEKYTPLHRFNGDMVFVDGEMLQSAGSIDELSEKTFFIDYDKQKVYIKQNPKDHVIEITAFNKAIYRVTKECNGMLPDHKGPVIRGLNIMNYVDTAVHIDGTYPQGVSAEKEHGKDVIGTIIENCKITYCSRIAFFLIGDSLTVRHCDISNTSTEGLYIVASNDVLLEKNIFSKNNIEHITGFYPSAVKIFNQCYRVTCRDNYIKDLPNSNGLWYDVGNVDGVFVNNFVENVGNRRVYGGELWRYMSGFFFEISKGAICTGNVFVNCDIGSFVLNSSNVQLCQNTYINSTANIIRTERSADGDHFGWHPKTGPGVKERTGHVFVNNLMVGENEFNAPLLAVYQTDSLCGEVMDSQVKEMDYNVFVRRSNIDTVLIWWRPYDNEFCGLGMKTPEELNTYLPNFSKNCKYFSNYQGTVFKGANKFDYSLSDDFTAADKGSALPVNIKEFLRLPANAGSYVGAFPKK